MRYFNYLTRDEEESLFYLPPSIFSNTSEKELLAYAVGAALYMPATRQSIADEIVTGKYPGLVSVVIDLEDAVGDHQVELAEETLSQQFYRLYSLVRMGALTYEELPLLFIRVRTPQQMTRMIALLEDAMKLVTGVALPKFNEDNGIQYFELIEAYNRQKPVDFPTLYGMPILETAEIMYRETRVEALNAIQRLLTRFKEYVLNVRIGATDFSSLYGLRRKPDMTVYDIGVLRDCITDIVNRFGRMQNQFVISGPVWEYFKSDRVLKPVLRQTSFEESEGRADRLIRLEYMNEYLDGLIREVIMDKENGLLGKTIIHPTHIIPVQSLYAVTHEEYMDAKNILNSNNGLVGVVKSQYSNKMNEIKPHSNWAKRIMIRSKVYGVLHEGKNFTSILIGQEPTKQEHSLISNT
ncbi:HpcH/HpaI aldolase/citrate lyase family protein [Paenibacillus sp. MZ04-78.2]|uniref:HpcH/HpaI aldolase/citrate lyase family protein n=1 Tax=Paenibacillus sp. MZ04-78.2 TaxID=2962034 RepID=UPI0020B7E31F|nr:HpcH/HpaI aldolase/citrate lyase family protein [Paenibacillus sp. MZ04-78.2]MCP3774298.1 HpcH/HpaI aldolase/citrate lyase family protein [Paenibacillus sp. MZ04-78.2]